MSGPLDEEVEALCVDLSLTLCRRVLDYWIIGRRPVQFYCNMQHSGGPSCPQCPNRAFPTLPHAAFPLYGGIDPFWKSGLTDATALFATNNLLEVHL